MFQHQFSSYELKHYHPTCCDSNNMNLSTEKVHEILMSVESCDDLNYML